MNIKVIIIEQLRQLQINMLRMSYQNVKSHSTLSGQGSILNILKGRGEISRTELGTELGMSRPALAELLAKMESKGLIIRSRDISDHRKIIVTLTEAGVEAARKNDLEKSPLPRMLDCLDGRELSEFNAYLERILAYNADAGKLSSCDPDTGDSLPEDSVIPSLCFECPGPDKCNRDYLKHGHDRPNPDYCKYADQFPF